MAPFDGQHVQVLDLYKVLAMWDPANDRLDPTSAYLPGSLLETALDELQLPEDQHSIAISTLVDGGYLAKFKGGYHTTHKGWACYHWMLAER